MRRNSELNRSLVELGFYLVRSRRHNIWKHPKFSTSLAAAHTPSDSRSAANTLAQAKRILRSPPIQKVDRYAQT